LGEKTINQQTHLSGVRDLCSFNLVRHFGHLRSIASLLSIIHLFFKFLNIGNNHYQMNFPNYLNHLRIREVQRMLGQENHKTMTLEGIARSVGFHSKPSFNASFKKNTGVTPTIYIKNLEAIRKEPVVL